MQKPPHFEEAFFYINDATVSAISDILFIVFFINFLVDDEVEFEQQLPATAATEQSASVAPMHFIIIFDVLTFIKIPPFSLQRFALSAIIVCAFGCNITEVIFLFYINFVRNSDELTVNFFR